MTDGQCRDEGFLMFAMIALILPLVVIVGSVGTSMLGRNNGLLAEIRQEKALMAAESGLDDALYMATVGTLVSGTPVSRDLGGGMAYTFMPVLLRTDGIDNDGDSAIDEADEDVFRMTIHGTYAGTRRCLAGYLGPLPTLPAITSAVGTTRLNMDIELEGVQTITGVDYNADGTLGPGPNVPGMAIATPGTTASLLSQLSATEQTYVTGNTPWPSLGTNALWAPTWPTLVQQLKNAANMTLTSDEYENKNWGSVASGVGNIVFRQGDLEFENVKGAGILIVTGEFEMDEASRWEGLVIVLGEEFEMEEGSKVFGSVLLGPGVQELEMQDGANWIRYSTQALALANSLLPSKYVTFNGWQEISLY